MTTKGDVVRFDSERERLGIGSTNQVLTVVAGLPAWASAGHVTQSRALEVACSDESTALTTSDNPKITFRMPYALTLNQGEDGLRASLTGVGSTSGTTTVDVHMNGTTIMSTTKCTIDYGDDTRPGGLGWEEYLPGYPFNGNIFLDISEYGGKEVIFKFQSRYDNWDWGLFLCHPTISWNKK